MMKRSFVFALGLVAALTASQAQAGTITTLHSTGVGLAIGATDPNYTMVAGSDGYQGYRLLWPTPRPLLGSRPRPRMEPSG